VLAWRRGYQAPWLRRDALAGATTAAVVIPQAMAYATIAGLPVQIGLYTAAVPLLVYALLGSSRALSVSTTSTLAALTGAAVGAVAHGDAHRALTAASTLAVLTGLLLLAAGLLELGFVADFISHPVLAGFKAGTGLLIAVGQLSKLLGIDQTGDHFFDKLWSALSQVGDIDWPTAAIAGGSVAVLVGLRRWAPKAVPAALIVVAGGIILGSAGVGGVALVGDVPKGLPTPVAPSWSLIGPLLPAAAGIALMAFVESIAAGRAVARDDEREPDADRELMALGAANVVGGTFQAFPAGGGLSQTAVNDEARSQLAGAISGGLAILTLLFLAGLFADLPQATLGALVVVSAMGLVQIEPLRAYGRIRRPGFLFGAITLVAVLLLGVLDGVLVGVLASMLGLVHALNHPFIDTTPVPGGVVLRVYGPIYFANVQRVRRQVLEAADGELVVLDMTAVTGADITALAILPALDRELAARGTTLRLASLNDRAGTTLMRSPAAAVFAGRVHENVDAALSVPA
jgi:SulP family sulfate permease